MATGKYGVQLVVVMKEASGGDLQLAAVSKPDRSMEVIVAYLRQRILLELVEKILVDMYTVVGLRR